VPGSLLIIVVDNGSTASSITVFALLIDYGSQDVGFVVKRQCTGDESGIGVAS
jgi:hypothetical protein